MFNLDLKDKVILITGGSDGLGYASAELLSSEGAKVITVSYTHLTLPTILLV